MDHPPLRLLALLALMLLGVRSHATNYYVDAVNGDDNLPGTSPALAWRTLEHVSSMTMQPGDSVLFHRGMEWRGGLYVDGYGAPGQPIVYGAFGFGADPVFKGSVDLGSPGDWTDVGNGRWESAISFDQEVDVLFHHTNDTLPLRANKVAQLAALSDPWDFFYDPLSQRVVLFSPLDDPADLANGIEVAVHDHGVEVEDARTHITLTGLDLRFYADDGIYTHTPGAGLVIDDNRISHIGGPGSTAFHGNGVFVHFLYPNDTITITKNKTYNIWHIGIFVPVGPTPSDLFGSRICDNELIMTGGSGIGVRYANGVEVSDNRIHKASVFITDRAGIGLENCDRMVVERNIISEAVDDGSSQYSGWLTAGIYTFGVNRSRFYYNIVSSGKVGIHLDDDDGSFGYSSTGNEICYNLCYDHGGIGIMVEQENDSTIVHNNTVVNSLHAGISFRGVFAGNSDHCSVRNNIVCNTVNSIYVLEIADTGMGLVLSNNCYFHVDPWATLVHWLGNDYPTGGFGSYQFNSGQDMGSLVDDPLFLDPGTWDLKLQAGSPCIDAGTPVGLLQDINGQPVPSGNGVDIGAHEHADSLTVINEQGAHSRLRVYPNPSDGVVHIELPQPSSGGAMIRLTTATGRLVSEAWRSAGPDGSEVRIDLSHLSPGVYLVQVLRAERPPLVQTIIRP